MKECKWKKMVNDRSLQSVFECMYVYIVQCFWFLVLNLELNLRDMLSECMFCKVGKFMVLCYMDYIKMVNMCRGIEFQKVGIVF